jgi:hypothetical protein
MMMMVMTHDDDDDDDDDDGCHCVSRVLLPVLLFQILWWQRVY